jgi:hypothetical protein
MQPRLRLPVVLEWGRWEGKDREGALLDINVAAPLADGRVLTGAVKWNARPWRARVAERFIFGPSLISSSRSPPAAAQPLRPEGQDPLR